MKALWSVIGIAFLVTHCSSIPVDENDPKSLFEDAERDIASDRYQVAGDKLRMVRNKFPYSNYSILAQLRTADVLYLQESWPEAAAAYELFCDLHPKHEKVAYAAYRAAESFFQDIPSTVARDLSPAIRALDGFESFLKKYPSDPQVADAQKRAQEIKETLGEKELYIARFYHREGYPRAEGGRLQKAAKTFPETNAAKTGEKRYDELKTSGKLEPKPE